MKFAIKIVHEGYAEAPHWDYYDDPRVKTNLDAFAYGKVMAEHWNCDLRPGESAMRILNAQVVGPGNNRKHSFAPDPRQLDMLTNRSGRTQ